MLVNKPVGEVMVGLRMPKAPKCPPYCGGEGKIG